MPGVIAYEALGNNFLISFEGPIDATQARALCEEHGTDGIIAATPGEGGVDLTMQLRNRDGSEAEVSGNGLACLGRAAVDAGRAAGPEVVVDTAAGRRRVTVGDRVTVELGEPVVKDTDDGALFVDIGNPHLVFAEGDVLELGRRHPDVNVEVITADGPDAIDMRVHERGVGITQACGSGAYASAVAAQRWGWVGDSVTVRQPGGVAQVDVTGRTYTVEVTRCR